MSKIEVNQISSQCGSTLTIGQSGDSIQLACGATQTGFGRTGTVDWDTTAKTASFTAVSGNGYFVNTTSGAITVTLPASPSAGDIVAVSDYAGTAATNNITIARNGSNIEGLAENAVINSTREARTYIYVDGTQGWVPVNTNDSATIPPGYVTATGGTITCCGDYKIHTFTGPGTFTVTCAGNPLGSNTVDYLVVAGGGGTSVDRAGGGGAGGYRESKAPTAPWTASPLATCASLPVIAQGYPITVGAGGAATNTSVPPTNPGNNSIFSSITSAGGGGGGSNVAAAAGGSGGGGRSTNGGAGNNPPVSPPQGNPGGSGFGGPNYGAGGGGGAGAVGVNGSSSAGGAGGNGVSSSISGSSVTRGGGGGGGIYALAPGPGGAGGSGGGGTGGSYPSPRQGTSGTANTGGGGGGRASEGTPGTPTCFCGNNGGSGVVIVRYKYR